MAMRPLNRWTPALPVTAMKTYALSLYKRKATCAEAECEHYLKGWVSPVPIGSTDEEILKRSGRKWFRVEERDGMHLYYFGEGQKCFKANQHFVTVDREPLHIVRDGDWRANPTGRRTQLRADQWLDSFKESTAKVIERKERG